MKYEYIYFINMQKIYFIRMPGYVGLWPPYARASVAMPVGHTRRFILGLRPKPRRGFAPDPTKGAKLLWNPAMLSGSRG